MQKMIKNNTENYTSKQKHIALELTHAVESASLQKKLKDYYAWRIKFCEICPQAYHADFQGDQSLTSKYVIPAPSVTVLALAFLYTLQK